MTWLHHWSSHSPIYFLQIPSRLPHAFPGVYMPGELPCWKSCMQTLSADVLWLLCTSLVMQSSSKSGLSSWLEFYSCFALLGSTKQSETHHWIWPAALPEVPLSTETSVLGFFFQRSMKILLTTEEFLNFHKNLGKVLNSFSWRLQWEDLLQEP